MKYEELSIINKQEAEEILIKEDSNFEIVSKVIIASIAHIDDFNWLENLCLKYINYDSFWVQKNCINGLGDIARIYRKLNDLDNLYKILSRLEKEKPELIGEIKNLKEDIDIFLS